MFCQLFLNFMLLLISLELFVHLVVKEGTAAGVNKGPWGRNHTVPCLCSCSEEDLLDLKLLHGYKNLILYQMKSNPLV